MKKHRDLVLNRDGNPVSGIFVRVRLAGTSTDAVIYSDNGGTVKTNPVITDTNGNFSFYVADGRYDLVYSGSGFTTYTDSDVVIEDVLGDLSGTGGASLVGYLPSDTGDVATDVQSKLRESVSVKDFGAVGDGVTDDTAALVLAFTRGGDIYVPRGTYLIKSMVAATCATNLRIIFDIGAEVKASATFPLHHKMISLTFTTLNSDFSMQGGKLDGSLMPVAVVGNAPDILYLADTDLDSVDITGTHFYNNESFGGTAGDSGLFVVASNVRVTNCIFQGAPDAGFYLSGDITGTLGESCITSDNVFIGCGVGFISKRQFKYQVVSNNLVKNCGSAIVVGGEADSLLPGKFGVISGNVIHDVERGISVRVSNGMVISGNQINNFAFSQSTGLPVTESGIVIDGSSDCVVTGNSISITTGTPVGAMGIRMVTRLINDITYVSDNTLITGNICVGLPTGTKEESGCAGTMATANKFVGVTDAMSFASTTGSYGEHFADSLAYKLGFPGAPSLSISPTVSSVNWVDIAGSTSNSPAVTSTGVSTDVNLVISMKGSGVLLVGGSAGAEAMRVSKGISGGNAVQIQAAAAGNGPIINARGTDANIDLTLAAKGTGNIRFGTHTTTTDSPVSGYITIKDSGGVTRKLAVIS